MTKSRGILGPRKVWSDADLALLTEQYPNKLAADVAAALGVNPCVIYAKAKKLGLKKSDEFNASPASGRLDGLRGADSRFQKGMQSWNKGTHYVAGGRSAENRFKKGVAPHNTVPVGTTVMSTDGYLKTKVAEPNHWKWTHRMNWESVNGPIPKGMMLVFKNENHEDCDPSNLELITRQEHIARHTIHNYPPELKQVIQLTGALKRKINNHGKRRI